MKTLRNITRKNGDKPLHEVTIHKDELDPLSSDALHDLITRNRDHLGNRKAYGYAYNIPTVDDTPIENSPLIKAINVVSEHNPGRAAQLEHMYNNKLLAAEKRIYDVRSAELLKLRNYNNRAVRENENIDNLMQSVEKEKVQATAKHREAIEPLNQSLSEAHKLAGEKVARVGAEYDPTNPSPHSVLNLGADRMRIAAAQLNLPWSPGNSSLLLPTFVSWVLSIVVGIMIGLSLGIMAQFLDPETITREPLPVLLFAVIGSAAAILGRAAIKYGHRQAAERSYLGLPWQHRIGVLLCALMVDVLIAVVDSLVEQQGLLATVRLQDMVNSLSGAPNQSNGHQTTYLFAAIILSVGYIVSAAWEGYLAGRKDILANRVYERFEEIDRERKRDPAVTEALNAIAEVIALRQQISERELHISEVARPFDQKIENLQARRLPVLDDLPVSSRERVQDAIDNFNGAQEEFDAAMEAALRECEDLSKASRIFFLRRKAARRRDVRDRMKR